jgi:hypothetical protein
LALEDVRRAFGATNLLGSAGSLIPYPPEATNPPLIPLPTDRDGRTTLPHLLDREEHRRRYGYIADQALAVARLHARSNLGPNASTHADRLTEADVFLIPTGATRQDVERGAPARYRLVYRHPATREIITAAMEWRADVSAAQENRGRADTGDTPPAADRRPAAPPPPNAREEEFRRRRMEQERR